MIKNLDLVEKLRYKVIQHVMEQNEHLKVCSKHIELVHNLVLQTNILSEALKLPEYSGVCVRAVRSEGNHRIND